jgi:hypothetical protein
MKAIEIQAPNELIDKAYYKKVFLAGSIEMGKAEDWQLRVIKALADQPIIFLNPRRKDWDSSWKQEKTDPQFKQQVTWELEGLEKADVIIIYFDPTTKSPISLLELGLHTCNGDKLIVLCPDGFYRKGNVDIVCERYDIKQVNSFKELIKETKIAINEA